MKTLLLILLMLAPPQAPPLLPPQAPTLSILVISKTGCQPCMRLAAELRAHGNDLEWDIWKDAPSVEAKYGGVTAYPTILLLRDGREIGRHVGYMSIGDLTHWRDNPDEPQSRSEAVWKAAPVAYSPPVYQPMRWTAACRGSS